MISKKQIYDDLKNLKIKYKDKIFIVSKSIPLDPYDYHLYDPESKKMISYLIPSSEKENSFKFKIEGEGEFLLRVEYEEVIDNFNNKKLKPKYIIEKLVEDEKIDNKNETLFDNNINYKIEGNDYTVLENFLKADFIKKFLIVMAFVILLFFIIVGIYMINIRSIAGDTIMEAFYHSMGWFSIAFGIFSFSLLLGISFLIKSDKENIWR